jgi:hypothetical protein
MAAGRKVGILTASNVTATNIGRRTVACMQHPDEFLVMRPWSRYLEEEAILRCAAHDSSIAWDGHKANPLRGHQMWMPDLSTAEWVLKLVRAIPTTNAKVLEMRAQHKYFIDVIMSPKRLFSTPTRYVGQPPQLWEIG